MSVLTYNKKHMKILMRILFVALLCLAVGLGTHYYSASLPRDKYSEGKQQLDKGNYKKAAELFDDIKGYADTDDIIVELQDEKLVFECIKMLEAEEHIDILQMYNTELYRSEEGNFLILSYGVYGEQKDTIIYRALFNEQDGEYVLYNRPIASFENTSLKTDEDKDTYNRINTVRDGNEDISKASLNRINNLLHNNVDVTID